MTVSTVGFRRPVLCPIELRAGAVYHSAMCDYLAIGGLIEVAAKFNLLFWFEQLIKPTVLTEADQPG
jgi:hypothetical protein